MRLDQRLFEEGIFDSREKAKQEILAGRVRDLKSGEVLDKPGMKVKKAQQFKVEERSRFVSRAGEKLESFLKSQNFSFEGRVVLDVGSSTGGFSDCVLQRGASKVYAVDVGTHQLHEKIRHNPLVEVYEQTDIRDLDLSALEPKPSWVLVDVSFISMKKFLGRLLRCFSAARFLLLYKPQFEVGRFEKRSKSGVVNEASRQQGLEAMLQDLKELGFKVLLVQDSAVKGAKGNQETFILAESSLPQHIFRAYDIRGEADRELSDQSFEKIGYVLGGFAQKKLNKTQLRFGVGRDDRKSSPRLFKALCRGLSHAKVELVDLGRYPTPMVYFAKYHFKLDAVLQVTASHNPQQDNGLKMVVGDDALFGEEIKSLGVKAEQVELSSLPEAVFSAEVSAQLETDYLKFLHEQFRFKRKFKLVLDTANGMSGRVARKAFEPYCEDLEILYEDVDCSFPNHPADPTVESNLQEIRKKVVESHADLGFAFDGDGDRLGLVSKTGRIFWGDEILMLLAKKLLHEKPGSTIIGEVKCSEKLFKMIESHGGKPVMYRTGHSLIKKKMKELQAEIAGEMSGHLFFGDRYFGFDDAVYAGLRVLEVIDEFDLDLDEWIQGFPQGVITPEIRLEVDESEKFALVEKVKSYFQTVEGAKLSLIDGVRASFEDESWLLIRASNTQAVLVLRIEASSESRLQELRAHMEKALGRRF